MEPDYTKAAYIDEAKIMDTYNKCSQNYSKFNTIQDNMTIFHCAVENNKNQ